MNVLIAIIIFYGLIFIFYGHKNLKMFMLFMAIFSMPMPIDYAFLFGYQSSWAGNVSISFSQIALIILFVISKFGMIESKQEIKLENNRLINFFCLLFLLASILSLMNANTKTMGIYAIFNMLINYFVFFYVIQKLYLDESELTLVVLFLVISLLFQGICGELQYFFGIDTTIGTGHKMQTAFYFDEVLRVAGTTGRPNAYALFMSSMIILTTTIIIAPNKIINKILLIISISLGFSGLLFSLSRGGWLSLAISLFLLILITIKSKLIKLGTLSRLFFIIMIIFAVSFPKINMRLSTDDQGSASTRLELMRVAFNMIEKHPFIGVGINNYPQNIKENIPNDYHGGYRFIVHNQFLLIWAEMGILGLLAFIGLIFVSLYKSYKGYSTGNHSTMAIISLGLCLALVTYSIHINIEYATSSMLIGYFLFLMSLVLSTDRLVTKDIKKK